MKKLLGLAVLSLSVGACESAPYRAYGPSFPDAKEGMAAVYLVRETPPAGTEIASIPISLDGTPLTTMPAASWVRLDLAPNPYDFRAFGSQESTELIITVVAGETRFLLVRPKGDNDAELLWLSQENGRKLVRGTSQVGTYGYRGY